MIQNKFILAIDIGSSKIRVGLFTESLKLVSWDWVEQYRGKDPMGLSHRILSLAERLLTEGKKVTKIGIASIGPIDVRNGVITYERYMEGKVIPVAKPIMERFGVECYMLNDATAAAYAEYVKTYGKQVENLVYLTISTGIGGGAVIDGCLLTGHKGNALEIGHIVIDYTGYVKCECGAPGHWEAYCSGIGIPRFAKKLHEDGKLPQTTNIGGDILKGALNSERIYELYRLGDAGALYVLNLVAELNVAGLTSVINTFAPEIVTIGGAVALNNTDYFKPIFERSRRYTIVTPPRIMFTSLRELAPLIGAAAVAVDELEKTLVKF